MMTTLKVHVTSKDHIRGGKKATVTLLEYGDYQCPYCGIAHPILKKIQEHYGDSLRFVFRHFPLTQMHPNAQMAAETAEFASHHNHFWEMHDHIYENQKYLNENFLVELAESLGFSGKELILSLQNETYASIIKEDFLGGVRSGVNGTPTLFINEQRYNGPIEFEEIVSVINPLI